MKFKIIPCISALTGEVNPQAFNLSCIRSVYVGQTGGTYMDTVGGEGLYKVALSLEDTVKLLNA